MLLSSFALKRALSATSHVDLDDSLNAKKALHGLGFYKLPTYGMTPYPDEPLFEAIEGFQRRHGLRVDGVMKPGGPTASRLATALAERRPPVGANMSSVAGVGKGSYIWRTAGDGKVRSSHADRDGKIFLWSTPPEGGHPGEAPNCRCWAEEVKPEQCQRLRLQLEADQANADAASDRWNKAEEHYNRIVDELISKIERLDDAVVQALMEAFPFLRAIVKLFKRKPVEPGDFAGPVPTVLEIPKLYREVAMLEKEYEKAQEGKYLKEKDMNEAMAISSRTLAEYRKFGCI